MISTNGYPLQLNYVNFKVYKMLSARFLFPDERSVTIKHILIGVVVEITCLDNFVYEGL